MGRIKIFCMVMSLALLGGCVQRTLNITSNPPGALVVMNDQEIGRTPITRDFVWYGTYDVQVRKEGYESLNKKTKIIAPWWQWVPIDLLAEFWPWHLKDIRHISYTLAPAATQPANPTEMFRSASIMKADLQSSQFTHTPTTGPSTKPTTRPHRKPTSAAS